MVIAKGVGLARAMAVMTGMTRPQYQGGVVLAYHDVQPKDRISTEYTVTPQTLSYQLTSAQEWGLQFVSLSELTSRWRAGQNIDGLASVVFDDALVGVYRYGAEILAECGVPGDLYPLTEGLGQRPTWWPGSARTMTGQELSELLDLGWGLGSHTRTHRSLPLLRPGVQRDEIRSSRQALEDATGRRISTIAYPFGHHDARVRDACREAGYEVGFSFLNGRVVSDLDCFKLPRLTMTNQARGLRWAFTLTRPALSWPDNQVDAVEGPTPS